MKSCSLHHWILFFISLIPVADLTFTSLTAKLHQPATLTCNQKCSGLMTWRMSNKTDILAYCDQISCKSEEGFEISHDQYLNGNLDLIIISVDYSKRTIFTCYCGDKAVCNVRLIIESLVSAVQKKPGEDLVLELHLTEPTEVVYKSKHTSLPNAEWICLVTDDSLQCRTDYEQRASLNHTELTLRDLKVSDSGVYIIRDMKYKEVLHKYVVSVEEWKTPLIIGISVGTVILLLVVIGICWILNKRTKKENKDLRIRNEHLLDSFQAAEAKRAQSQMRSNSDMSVLQLMKQMAEVDELIEKYGNKGRSFQTWNSTKDISLEELLSKKEAEMDESLCKMNIEENNEWWRRKKAQLNEIIKECRRTREELTDFSISRRTKSWPGIQRIAKPEELVELNPIGVRRKQK